MTDRSSARLPASLRIILESMRTCVRESPLTLITDDHCVCVCGWGVCPDYTFTLNAITLSLTEAKDTVQGSVSEVMIRNLIEKCCVWVSSCMPNII